MESIRHIKKSNQMFTGMLKDWKEKMHSGSHINKMGRIKNYTIFSMNHMYGSTLESKSIALQDRFGEFALIVEFGLDVLNNPNLLEEDRLAVRSGLQGQNLPVQLYVWLLRRGFTIMSSYSHSLGGRAVWEKLCNTTGVDVIAYNLYEEIAFQINSDNLHNEELWTADIQDEINSVRLESAHVKNSEKLKQFKKTLRSLEKALTTARYIRLVANLQ